MISLRFRHFITFIFYSLLSSMPTICLADDHDLTIVFAADMPVIGQEEQGSYAQLASAINRYRSQQSNSLFLFGGNSLGPSPMSSFDNGSHIIDLLNGLEPDAMAVAKREYIYHEEQLSLRAFEAAFPLLASNIFEPLNFKLQDGLSKSAIIRNDSINLGVIAIVDPEAKQQYLLKRVIVQEVVSSVRAESQRLRARGADVIAVMHGTLIPDLDALLNEGIIDLTLLKDPFAPEQAIESAATTSNKVLIHKQSDIAIINISRQSEGGFKINWQAESLLDYQPNKEIAQQESGYINRLDRLMKLPISTVSREFNTFRNEVRTSENAFANLITDVMIESTNADLAIINSGGIRGDRHYDAEHVFTRKDLTEELPFITNTVILELSGHIIAKSIEDAIADYPLLQGKFPQVANMEIIFDGNNPPGNRLLKLTIKGQPIQMDKLYKVATIGYLFNGGDGYQHFANGRLLPDQKLDNASLQDLVLNSILSRNYISLATHNRIVDVSKNVDQGSHITDG